MVHVTAVSAIQMDDARIGLLGVGFERLDGSGYHGVSLRHWDPCEARRKALFARGAGC